MPETFKPIESQVPVPESAPELEPEKVVESQREIEWRWTQERIDVYKKSIQEIFDDLQTLLQAKETQQITLPESGTEGKELRAYLEALRARIDTVREANNECVKQINGSPQEIEGIDPASPDALSRIHSQLSGISSLYSNLAQYNAEDEACAEKYNSLIGVYNEVRMKEEGFKDDGEIQVEVDRLYAETHTKESSLFGLGRIFNKKELAGLEERRKAIEDLRYPSFSTRSYYPSRPICDEGDAIDKILRKVTEVSLVIKKEFDTNTPEEPEAIPEETLTELNTRLVDNTIRPSIMQTVGENAYKKNKKNIDKTIDGLLELLVQSFSVNMRDMWLSDGESVKKRDRIREGMKKLDPEDMFTYFINNWMPSGVADDTWKKFNETISRQDAGYQWARQCIDMFEECKAGLSGSAKWKAYGSYDKLKETLPYTGDFAGLDIPRWNVFKQCETFKEIYGSRLPYFEKNLKIHFERELLNSNTSRDLKKSFTGKLLELHSVNTAPYLLLHSFRVGREHGHYPFLPAHKKDSSLMYDCFSAYTPEDMETLRAMNIPGLVEAVELVRSHKDDFAVEQEYVEEKGAHVTNPVNKEIYENLRKITNHLLIHDKKSVFFVLDTLAAEGDDRELGKEQMNVLAQLLVNVRETPEYEDVKAEISKALFTRYDRYNRNMESLAFMLDHDLLDTNQKQEVFDTIIPKWADFIDEKKGLSAVHMTKLVDMMTPLIKERVKADISEKGGAIKKIGGFLAAQNMDLEFKPTAQEIVLLFETKETTDYRIYDKYGWEHLVGFSKDITFSKDESGRIFSILANIFISESDSMSLDEIDLFQQLMVNSDVTSREKNFFQFLKGVSDKESTLEKTQGSCSTENWPYFLAQYAKTEHGIGVYNAELSKKLKAMFSAERPENRDLCLRELKQDWQTYLASGGEKLPWGTAFVCRAVKSVGGAGDLKYVEGITEIINSLNEVQTNTKAKNSTQEIFDGFRAQEERFEKEGWSEDDKTAFYHISKKVLDTSPSLCTDFINVFASLNVKELKDFTKDFYPLYQANLIVLENAEGKVDGRKLVPIRKRLEMFAQPKERNYEKEKHILVATLQENVQARFGLISVPETMTDEHIRSMKNCIRFIANISEPDKTKELIISLYLGLSLHGAWEKFRAGTITLSDYFSPEKAALLEPLITERKELFASLETSMGLEAEQSPAFFNALQEETFATVTGNVQTIDIKLGNVKRGLEDLRDMDLYQTEREKKSVVLAFKMGKAVGATLSKKYQQTQGKKIAFSPEETEIDAQLNDIYGKTEWKSEEVKKAQADFQLLGLVSGIIRKMNDESIGDAILKLQNLLKPTEEIIAIFNSFGEEFKPTSGALALSQDLSYLENIIVKNSDKIGENERKVLDTYLNAIRSQMTILESEYVVVKDYFDKIKKSSHMSNNELFKNRIKEIEQVIYQSDEKVPIGTVCTSNLNKIIENMRQCLGCMRKEGNNDTNLAFGDPNKFYMMSAYGDKKGSNADQIVFFAPLTIGEREEASFVMDRLYGTKSADVLTAHIETVLKKYKGLAKQFKQSRMSVFVTNEALASAGMSVEGLTRNLEAEGNNLEITPVESASVAILKSAFGDNYVEFGTGAARSTGNRAVSGVRIALKA